MEIEMDLDISLETETSMETEIGIEHGSENFRLGGVQGDRAGGTRPRSKYLLPTCFELLCDLLEEKSS